LDELPPYEGVFPYGSFQLGRRKGPLIFAPPINGRLLRNIAWPQTTIMFPPPTHFTELPTEVSERILLHLPAQDIIKMEAVCRP